MGTSAWQCRVPRGTRARLREGARGPPLVGTRMRWGPSPCSTWNGMSTEGERDASGTEPEARPGAGGSTWNADARRWMRPAGIPHPPGAGARWRWRERVPRGTPMHAVSGTWAEPSSGWGKHRGGARRPLPRGTRMGEAAGARAVTRMVRADVVHGERGCAAAEDRWRTRHVDGVRPGASRGRVPRGTPMRRTPRRGAMGGRFSWMG